MNIDPSQYAALSRFLRGYLHQDAAVEYSSPAMAARDFHKDTDAGESAIVRSELDWLLSVTSQSPFDELSQALESLGCNWHFRSRAEVEQLRDALK